MKRIVALAVIVMLAVSVVGSATPSEDTGRFYNILPPGQNGTTTIPEALQFGGGQGRPAHFDDQLPMYANLLYDYDDATKLNDATVTNYFKEASLADPGGPAVTPKPGVTITRDAYGVPHVEGATLSDVAFGAGYVTGVDRLFFTDVLRFVGRGRLSEFLGASEANLAMDRDLVRVAGYSEAELQLQVDLMPLKFGGLGTQTVQMLEAYVRGMNARVLEVLANPTLLPAEYPALQLVPTLWKSTDIIAIATLIQAVFAAGGGGELGNAELLRQLTAKHGATTAQQIYRDLLNREDPDAPVSANDGSFPYQVPGIVTPASVAIPDAGSVEPLTPLQTLRQRLAAMGIDLPGAMSNWLAVTGEHTADGHPIALMGPQTGYFSPQILMEISLHGGGVDTRGATFPGIGFVLLGRGKDFAWSATSGGSDLVDIRVEKLCEPDGSPATKSSKHYLFGGVCTKMYQRTDTYFAKPSAGALESSGLPAEPTIVTQHVERTTHGPVFARATVGGAPVALVIQRSTFFGEADSSPAFILLNSNQVHDPESFKAAMNYVTGSFNWLYVDDDDVAFFHSGLYPKRAAGVNDELPVWGTGEWEWDGFVPLGEHPNETGPSAGYIASWNNKPAREWRASDNNYSYSPVYRVQSLTERLAPAVAAGGITVVDMIKIMEDAASVDLRGSQVVPDALQVLGADPEIDAYTSLLASWVAGGAHRRAPSRAAPYEGEAAVALMDAWYDRLVHAVFDDELDGVYGAVQLGFDDGNREGHVGSAFQGGYYGHLQKALRQALGEAVGAPYTTLACGTTLGTCRDALKASLVAAVAALNTKYPGGPASWKAPKADEEIRFSPVGLVDVDHIDWQNRPTFQQVVQVLRPRD